MLQRVFTRVSKPAARYSDRGSAQEHCSACRFFMSGGDCARVLGRVMPQGWCKYFSREAVQRWNPLGPMGNLPAGLSLDLSFMSPGVLDPRVTFTRTSGGTYFDSTGTMRNAAVNLCLYSADLSNAAWTPFSQGGPVVPIVTGNQTVAPDGTVTAARIVYPAVSAGTSEVYQQLTVAAAVYSWSVYLKGNVGGEQINLLATIGAVSYFSIRATLTTAWQRFTVVTGTLTAGPVAFAVGCDLRDAGQLGITAQTIYAWGAQVELGSTASPYIPTTSTPMGAPRWDYNLATLALNGLLIEEARTNLILQSGNLSAAPWSPGFTGGASLPVITGNSGVAPDGTTTAALISLPAVSGGSSSDTAQGVAVTAAAYSFSIWLRGSVGGERVYLFATPDAVTYRSQVAVLTTSWQRFVLSGATLTATTWYFALGVDLRDGTETATPAQSFYVWGAQVEQGAFPTSYIPTTAAAATRAGDVASMPTAAWYSQNIGSTYAEFINGAWSAGGILNGLFEFDDATNANSIWSMAYATSSSVFTPVTNITVASTSTGYLNSGAVFTLPINKQISAWSAGSSLKLAVNGGPVQSAALTTVPTITRLLLGSAAVGGPAPLNGWLRRMRYWPRVLSNAEMQQVTT